MTTPQTFAALGVPQAIADVLASQGKTEAFPIQADTLPDTLQGRDVLGRGKTGSGKTLGFLAPAFSRILAAGPIGQVPPPLPLPLTPDP